MCFMSNFFFKNLVLLSLYRSENNSDSQFMKVKELKDVFEYTIRSLEPNTTYDVRIMSFTPNRVDGPCAPVLTVRTAITGR